MSLAVFMHSASGAPNMAVLRKLRARHKARKYSWVFLFVALMAIYVYMVFARGSAEDDMASPMNHFSRIDTRRLGDGNVKDQFSVSDRRHGAIIFHFIGLFYMFVGIAIVCDECFVPALEVITEILELSPDVAGATFMAAGGSAPEFFTSLIGAMVTESDIGTGTIIGSAVFNVLFVIGACALVAPEPLQLTWFPLARDASFYAVSLIVVTCTFLDETVKLGEALVLFILYMVYISFMKYSERIEAWATGKQGDEQDGKEEDAEWATKRDLGKLDLVQGIEPPTAGTGEESDGRTYVGRTSSSAQSGIGAADGGKKLFRHQSMRVANHVTALKPLTDGMGSINVSETDADCKLESIPVSIGEVDAITPSSSSFGNQLELTNVVPTQLEEAQPARNSDTTCRSGADLHISASKVPEAPTEEDGEEENEPLSIWPPDSDASLQDRVYYFMTLPIVLCLVCTIPDVRRPGWRNYYALTFFMSTVWIAAFTWAMVWFASVIASTFGCPDTIMGLTILAAGTSVPDMLTSMIVAREGQGDMAISSSIGSNIFDVTIGLPVPWMLFMAIRQKDVEIQNQGLEISVLLLLGMLGATIGIIMWHNWVMTKGMGGVLMALYIVFEVIAVGLTFAPAGSLKLIHV